MRRLAVFSFVVIACGAPPAPAPRLSAPSESPAAPALPAFVVYGREGTLLVPTVDGEEAASAPGLWVLSDAMPEPTLRHLGYLTGEALGSLPECPCASMDGVCEVGQPIERRFDAQTLEPLEAGPECGCVLGETTMSLEAEEEAQARHEWPDPPAIEEEEEEDAPSEPDEEYDEGCEGDGGREWIALVGGRLFLLGWEWNGACDGAASVYDSYSDDLALVDPPPEPFDLPEGGYVGCDPELVPGEVSDLELPDEGSAPCAPDASDDECGYCEDAATESGDVLALARGWLWRVADSMSHAGATRWYWRTPARPGACPAAADPCGDPAAFEGIERHAGFWVATDGSAALLEDEGRYRVWAPGGRPGPAAPPAELGVILGVRHHADARVLREAMRRHGATRYAPPQGAGPAPACARPEECEEGRCESGRCVSPCGADAECHARGLCGGWCAAGACHALGDCDEDHPCDSGRYCEEGLCGPPARIAAADVRLVDRRGGRAWAARCARHRADGRLSAAQGACERGLAMARDARVRGAILYELGSIAEQRGELVVARRRYTESLAARPGDAAAQGRLDRLPPPIRGPDD